MREGDSSDSALLPRDAGDELWRWFREVHLGPELKRRIEAGTIQVGDPLFRAQVLFRMSQEQPEVRINHEVVGTAQISAHGPIDKGDAVTQRQIKEITGFLLPEEDADAAHLTWLVGAKGGKLFFDGTYNTLVIDQHIAAADEFLVLARLALKGKALRGFIENAFSAAELLAKAELLPLPERRVLEGRKHTQIRSLYNQWAQLGNTEIRFAALLNRLGDIRRAARYLKEELDLGPAAPEELLADLEDLREHVETTRPRRDLRSKGKARSYKVEAIQEIRSGQLVGWESFRVFR